MSSETAGTIKQHREIYGISFMLVNTLVLAILDVAARILGADLPSPVIVFFYKFGLFILITPWVLKEGVLRLKTKRLWMHASRSLLSVLGVISFFHGLKFVDMADAAALENIQYLIVVLVGLFFFRERFTKTKMVAVICGFLGVIFVINPMLFLDLLQSKGKIETDLLQNLQKYKYTLIAMFLWSGNTILVKVLGNTEHNKTQLFYLLLFASIWSLIVVFVRWGVTEFMGLSLNAVPRFTSFGYFTELISIKLELKHLALLLLMATCYFIHGIAYFLSLKSELSVVIPFRYTKLLFSAILGYLIFGEVSSYVAYFGYVLIIGSGLILFRYEIKRAAKIKKKQTLQI